MEQRIASALSYLSCSCCSRSTWAKSILYVRSIYSVPPRRFLPISIDALQTSVTKASRALFKRRSCALNSYQMGSPYFPQNLRDWSAAYSHIPWGRTHRIAIAFRVASPLPAVGFRRGLPGAREKNYLPDHCSPTSRFAKSPHSLTPGSSYRRF